MKSSLRTGPSQALLMGFVLIAAPLFLIKNLLFPWLMKDYLPSEGAQSWSDLTLRDPKIGDRIISTLDSRVGISGPAIVMAISDCSKCNAQKIRMLGDTAVASGVRLYAVVTNAVDLKDLTPFHVSAPRVSVVRAPVGFANRWNSSFLPRIYAVDRTGRLAFIQGPNLTEDVAFRSAGDILK